MDTNVILGNHYKYQLTTTDTKGNSSQSVILPLNDETGRRKSPIIIGNTVNLNDKTIEIT